MGFKSGFEASFAKALKANGIKFEYEPMVVSFVQPEKKRKYTPDFKIRTKSKGVLVVETKGRLTRADRQKMLMIRESNPKLNVILLFQNSSIPIQKGSKTTYGDWAKDNGFEFYDFRNGIPKEWK